MIMKKLFLFPIALIIFIACEKKAERYTQASAEIETYKATIADYEAGNWEAWTSHYSDTAKIYHNTKDKFVSPKEMAGIFMEQNADLASYGFMKDEGDIEMVVTDEGHTWVNFWGQWQGTLKANNQVIDIPVHLTAQFVDGKIVEEYAYYDNAGLMTAMMEIEAAAAALLEAEAAQTEETPKK